MSVLVEIEIEEKKESRSIRSTTTLGNEIRKEDPYQSDGREGIPFLVSLQIKILGIDGSMLKNMDSDRVIRFWYRMFNK